MITWTFNGYTGSWNSDCGRFKIRPHGTRTYIVYDSNWCKRHLCINVKSGKDWAEKNA